MFRYFIAASRYIPLNSYSKVNTLKRITSKQHDSKTTNSYSKIVYKQIYLLINNQGIE